MTSVTKEAPSPKEACTHSQIHRTGLMAAEEGRGLLWAGESGHHPCTSSQEPAGGPCTHGSESGPCTGQLPRGPGPALGTSCSSAGRSVFHLHRLGLQSCAQSVTSGSSPCIGLLRLPSVVDQPLTDAGPATQHPGCFHATWDTCS